MRPSQVMTVSYSGYFSTPSMQWEQKNSSWTPDILCAYEGLGFGVRLDLTIRRACMHMCVYDHSTATK